MIIPPLKWHGGKQYLASRIIAMMPVHKHYVEPYAGGLSVLLAKEPEGVSEVVNDLNDQLTNFWRVMAEPHRFREFKRIIDATPFSEPHYAVAQATLLAYERQAMLCQATAAAAFFIVCRQSLAGRMKSFAPLSRNRIRRGMNEQASAWLTCIDGLPAVHDRLRRVVILHGHAIKVIEQQDGPETLFYLDPPYMPVTRTSPKVYACEMTRRQHVKLLRCLLAIKGKFILSGYDNRLYRAAERMGKWHRREFDLPNNAAGGETKRRMTEVVWCNFDIPASEKGEAA